MTDGDDSLSEDDLLAPPSQALPGNLSRLWAICSRLLHEREAGELSPETDVPLRAIFPWTNPHQKRRRDRLAYEQAMRQIGERQDRLLLCIEDEQSKIGARTKEIEDNALRLRDGRRVYVDGETYRDGAGRGLAGVDEAEASRQHEYRPDISTWQRRREIDRQADEMRRLKEKIRQEAMGGRRPTEGNLHKQPAEIALSRESAARLSGYEQEFAEKVAAREEALRVAVTAPDGVPSAVPAFTAAAGSPKLATGQKPNKGDTGAAAADMKKGLARPEGEGANHKTPRHADRSTPKPHL